MKLPSDIGSQTAAYKQYLEIYNHLESGDLRPQDAVALFDELHNYIVELQARFEVMVETCPDYLVGPFEEIADGLLLMVDALTDLRECTEENRLKDVRTELAWEAEQMLRQARDRIIALHLETSGEDLSSQFQI